MFAKHRTKLPLIVMASVFFLFTILDAMAFARVGGGRSSGSRGSRSYSSPQQGQPSQPQRQYSSPAQPASPQPGQFSGSPFLRGLAGGIIGGMVGGMLFRSLGMAGGSGEGGGIGLFDILLIGALLYGIYWFVVKRRRQDVAATAAYRSAERTVDAPYQTTHGGVQVQDAPAHDDWARGLDHIRQMDPAFDEGRFPDLCTDLFFSIQGAWANRDMTPVRDLLTDEMLGIIQRDADRLRSEGRINRLDNIAVRAVEIAEAWQETGRDFITMRFLANLLDYTVDERTGKLVSGSKDAPVKFEEYWTFTRPVGSKPWRLSAITQA